MPLAQVDVANYALARLGARSIATLQDNSVEARTCNRLFLPALNLMLAAEHWPFATAKTPLVATDNPTVPFPWEYEYAMPALCLMPRYMTVQTLGQDNMGNDDRVPYEQALQTVDSNLVQVLWCNISPVTLCYTISVPNPALWDSGFLSAFSIQLAAEIALPITGNGQIASALRQSATEAVQLLHPQGLNEGVSGPQPGGSRQIDARGG